ncbi:MAG TPA: hypothetical protein VGL23_21165 [Chloroflexota bacterium]|jgi:hypothetical protein
MASALRCLFFLAAIGGLIGFLYVYRRKTNLIVAIVLFSYAVGAGSRLLRAREDDELLRNSLLALAGLAVAYGLAWVLTRYLERRGWRPED